MKKLILIFICVLIFGACQCQDLAPSYFRVEIKNEAIAKAIRLYVDENEINTKEKIISLQVGTGSKEVITISNNYDDLYTSSNHFPTYYGLLDEKIVFVIYMRMNKIISVNSIQIIKEIDRLLEDKDIKLDVGSRLIYDPPIWRLIQECDGSYTLEKKVSPMELESIPCGYSIIRSPIKLDSLLLIKK